MFVYKISPGLSKVERVCLTTLYVRLYAKLEEHTCTLLVCTMSAVSDFVEYQTCIIQTEYKFNRPLLLLLTLFAYRCFSYLRASWVLVYMNGGRYIYKMVDTVIANYMTCINKYKDTYLCVQRSF